MSEAAHDRVPTRPGPVAPPPESARLNRATLSTQIRDQLVVDIACGRVRPGDRLREMEIAQRLGTSQTPVREAFRELAALGLLETRTHAGTRVREVGERELVDAVPVRAALEGLAGRLAAPRLQGRVQALEETLVAMHRAAADGDRLALAGASTRFHRSVVAAAGNESLTRAWNALGIEVMTIVTILSMPTPPAEAAEHHRPILEALRAGDGAAAEEILVGHVAQYVPALHGVAEVANAPGSAPR